MPWQWAAKPPRNLRPGSRSAAAAEGTANFENWRIYGQAGFAGGVGGMAADDNAQVIYAHGVIGYYLDPNLVVSANFGVNHWSWDDYDQSETGLTWGARVEKRFEDAPTGAYLTYQGWSWDGGDDLGQSWSGSEHGIFGGVRIAFGDGTLQEVDQGAGLSDLNPAYGDLPH